jgi:DNA-nicking Smr family endonuclease
VRESVRPATAQPKQKTAPTLENRGAEKRVRRGQLDIGATLDLHGHTQDTGRAALGRFIKRAHARGDGVVIVVTGVGRGGAGVLKRMLPEWLADPALRALVSGFAQAHRTHGGAGAYYVFLRRARTT